MITNSTEPIPVVRQRNSIETKLTKFDPKPTDTPSDRLRQRVTRSIVDVIRHKDTQDRLEAETLHLIANGSPEKVDANTEIVEHNIHMYGHMDRMASAVIDSTMRYGAIIEGEAPEVSVGAVLSDAFDEVWQAYCEDSTQAGRLGSIMPNYGLAPTNGQDFVGMRTANV